MKSNDASLVRRILLVGLAMVLVVAVPFFLKPEEDLLGEADETLVVISPHNEAVRHEFAVAFSRHYKSKTGRSIRVDWRTPGGTSEIARYLAGEYLAAFENAWKSSGRKWNPEIAHAFSDPKVELPEDPAMDVPAQAARRFFLASNVGVGIDIFFGGGAYDFQQQAAAGRLVPSDVIQQHPEWFKEDSIPQKVSGEVFYDAEGRWVGACLSSFGICYNSDSLQRLGVEQLPASWEDLANPVFYRQVALADPTKSGSAAKAFEMVIQQQMQQFANGVGSDNEAVLALGWTRGLQIIQAASANARYFTDSAPKIPLDVSLGDAAIGMCIDFYGRFQSESVRIGDSPSRLQYFTPTGGSSVGVDPIALLRGAPHREAAEEFISFVLSLEGQKLWNFKIGAPGGPHKYALRRLPIRKELYLPEYAEYRSDPEVMPYEEAKHFTYHAAWTAPLFRTMAFIIRVICLDLHHEQSTAWQALMKAGFPKEAFKVFTDMSAVNYSEARTTIKSAIDSNNRINEVRVAKELSDKFRSQYRDAARLAQEGR
jgi:ABC-type Fe3+ transport system substrate-binding protein